MKDIYIADLANFDEGKLFDGYFIVLAKQQRTTKNNKPYLSLILGDKTGQLEGRVWEPGDPRIAKDLMHTLLQGGTFMATPRPRSVN